MNDEQLSDLEAKVIETAKRLIELAERVGNGKFEYIWEAEKLADDLSYLLNDARSRLQSYAR